MLVTACVTLLLSRLLHLTFLDRHSTEKGYPLQIRPTRIVLEEAPLDRELLVRILSKIDYGALCQARLQLLEHCATIGTAQNNDDLAWRDWPELPETLPETLLSSNTSDSDDETTLLVAAALFRWLFEIHVLEGMLVCPDTGREFPIKDGIPNMILHEDEL
jgi:multifunctional methyltransferase subunit TRM112